MKKLICICLMALVICGLCLGVSAEGEPTATLASSENVRQGKTIAVALALDNCGPVNGYRVELVYDKEIFSLTAGIWKQTNEPLDLEADIQQCEIFPAAEPGNSPIMTFTLRAALDAPLDQVCEVTCIVTLLTEEGEITVTPNPVLIKINCPHEYHKNATAEYRKSPATCLDPAVYYESCALCGVKSEDESRTFFYGEALGHNFKDREMSAYLSKPGDCQRRNEYFVSCIACGLQGDETFVGRTFGEHVYDFDCDKKCNTCFSERIANCVPGEELFSDDKGHWYTCTMCQEKVNGERHIPGPDATPEVPQTCTVCDYILAVHQDHVHDFSDQWLMDEESHWHECACKEVADKEAHQWDTTDPSLHRCQTCGQTKQITLPEPEQPTEPTTPTVQPAKTSNAPLVVLGCLLILSLSGNMALLILLATRKKK